MKKIFTLLAMALMTMGASAQTITFSEAKSAGTLDGATFGTDGFVLTVTDKADGGKLSIDENKQYFGTVASPVKYEFRLKTGGKSDSKNALKLTVPSSGKLTIAMRSSSSSATRKVEFIQGSSTLGSFSVKDDNKTTGPVEGEEGDKSIFTYYTIEKVSAGDINITYDGGTNFYSFEFESDGTTVVPLDPTAATTWDFTKELGTDDAANLEADATNWSFDSENGYWANKTVLTDRNVFTALKANGAELAITKGLTFTRDHNSGLDAGRIRIAPEKFFAINGSAVIINFGTLAKDDVIRIRMKGAGESERSITPSNAEATEGSLTTADVDQHEVSLKVKVDGEVTLTPTNGFQFLAITINADLPVVDGISTIKAETTTDAPVYNLQGQRVDASYRGVVIKNGKKAIQK